RTADALAVDQSTSGQAFPSLADRLEAGSSLPPEVPDGPCPHQGDRAFAVLAQGVAPEETNPAQDPGTVEELQGLLSRDLRDPAGQQGLTPAARLLDRPLEQPVQPINRPDCPGCVRTGRERGRTRC